MAYSLSARSLAALEGVHPDLVAVIEDAIKTTTQDFMVVQGCRTKEQMWANYGKGRTAAQCAAKGVPVKYALPSANKVTWLRDPLMSNHRIMPDGFGHAVDLGSYPYGSDPKKYRAIWLAVMAAAERRRVKVRAGIDWDADGNIMEKGETDLGHFELVK